jgi:hypothetical protein
VPGGGHTMFTWRALMPPLLEWMTPQLADNVAAAAARQAHAARRAATMPQATEPKKVGV